MIALVLAATKAADPNIIWPAAFAAIPVTLVALGGFLTVLWRMRKDADAQEKRDASHKAMIETNHGLRPGEYLEMNGAIALWAIDHTGEANDARAQLGLPPGATPQINSEVLEKLRKGQR